MCRNIFRKCFAGFGAQPANQLPGTLGPIIRAVRNFENLTTHVQPGLRLLIGLQPVHLVCLGPGGRGAGLWASAYFDTAQNPLPSCTHTIESKGAGMMARMAEQPHSEPASTGIEAIIRAKRDGIQLSEAQVEALVEGVRDRSVSDVQLGAFLMAAYLQGLTVAEQACLTLAMRDSGSVLQWPDLPGPVLDKHSTGGVGDLVSLVLAPLLAACGAFVPMISGRGLGHTGGTLDKLESIPGFNVNPGLEKFQAIVRSSGFALVGQGPDLAPVDRRMYAARDVTATVSSTPLIVASILSKKLAEGLDGLVMDVKIGNGAVLAAAPEARALGKALVATAEAAGLPCTAVFTDMNQPLASSAGNALEVHEAIHFLTGEPANSRLTEVVLSLAVELLAIGGLETDPQAARNLLQRQLASGAAAERFARVVVAQGGPPDLLERPSRYLAKAPCVLELKSPETGWVQAMNTRRIGRLVQVLGGGRRRETDNIDPSVGLSRLCRVGQQVSAGEPLAVIHAPNKEAAQRAARELLEVIKLGGHAIDPKPAVIGRITKRDLKEHKAP